MATQQEIDSFYQFASGQLEQDGAELSIHELLVLWRAQNPPSDELRESVAAVQAALTDMENGDTGQPVEDVINSLRQQTQSLSDQ